MSNSLKSIVDSVHRVYSQLSDRERLVADLVLETPGEISMYPASELARLVGVSNSTVTRFVRRTGFRNYEEMRRSAREARNWGSPLFLAQQADHAPRKSTQNRLVQFAEQEIELLQRTLGDLTPSRVDEIATALAKAHNLGFMGFRNSYYFAAYARWQFIQFRDKTRMIPGSGETVAERIADLGDGDVVLVVGVRRIVGILKRYLEAISNTGASVLLITDPSARGIPAIARWTITCPVENSHVFDSYSGVLAVLRLLAYETFEKIGKPGREYMQKIEERHEELAEFE